MEERVKYFMQQTLLEAEKALKKGELPIAALVVLDDEILAKAFTQEKQQKRFLVHAELLALEQADQIQPFPGNRRSVELFTNLEPCLMCLGASMSFFLGKIYFGLESPGDGAANWAKEWQRKEKDFPAYQLPQITGGVLREGSRELFKKYLEQESKETKKNFEKSEKSEKTKKSGMVQWVEKLVYSD